MLVTGVLAAVTPRADELSILRPTLVTPSTGKSSSSPEPKTTCDESPCHSKSIVPLLVRGLLLTSRASLTSIDKPTLVNP